MADTVSKEQAVANNMTKLLSDLGVHDIPESLIRQVASRMGGKSNPNIERKLKASLTGIGVTPIKSFRFPETIEFDIEEAGGSIPLKESFDLNGHIFQRSEIIKDLFCVVKNCLQPVLGITSIYSLDSPAGFQSMHNTVRIYLKKCDDGDFDVNHAVIKYFQNICLAAQREILGKENTVDTNNVLKYQRYLAVQKALLPFRTSGKAKDFVESKALLETPFVAEKAIELIKRSGFIYEEAGAIYNRRFGCAYEPIIGVGVICVRCNRINRFQRIAFNEKCSCGEPLFRKCKKTGCGAPVSRIADVCPICGARESDYIQLATLSQAESYVEKGCVEQAELCFAYAQNSAPDRQAELNKIQALIDRLKADRDNALGDIELLINQRSFYAASRKLTEAKRKFPSDVLQNIERRIINAQNSADHIFAAANSTAEELQKVLAVSIDHPGALELISKIPPKPPARLAVSTYDEYIQLSWEASADIGVKYRVVRKKESPPDTVFDGDGGFDIMTEQLHARDLSPVTGKIYYAVFAERGSAYSLECALKAVVFLPDVSALSLRQLRDGVEISYKLPKGANEVSVKRKVGDNNTLVYRGTNSIVIDRYVPEQCLYKITALFDNRESKGKIISFMASVFPEEIEPQIRLEHNSIHVSWYTTQSGYDVMICGLTRPGFLPETGKVYSDRELAEKTSKLADVSCEEATVSFEVKPNSEHTLIVMIGNFNGWLCCGVFPVFAGVYPKLIQAPHTVDVQGNHYFSFDGSFPPNVCGFTYSISKTKEFPDDGKYRAGNMKGYNGTDRPMIKIQNLEKSYVGRCYIFCRFKLNSGKETEPMGYEVHFRQDIQAQVNLRIRGVSLKGNIRIKLGRYDFSGYSELPGLRLMVGSTAFDLDRYSVSSSKTVYLYQVDLELPAPVNNEADIRLVPVNNMFINDFTINYKY